MIKRTINSLLAGAALAVMISFSPSVLAACNGRCADSVTSGGETYAFSSCIVLEIADEMRVYCYYSPLRLSIDG